MGRFRYVMLPTTRSRTHVVGNMTTLAPGLGTSLGHFLFTRVVGTAPLDDRFWRRHRPRTQTGGRTLPWVLVAWVLVLGGIVPCAHAHGACVIPVLGTQMCTHAAACIDHDAAEDRNGNCLFHYLPFPSPSVF